jgi:hypothetical protein
MRFTPDACITCGTKYRDEFESEFASPNFITDNKGTFYNTPFWFCSDDCIGDALQSLVDRRFHMDRTPYNDPALPDDHIEEFVEDWIAQARRAYDQATDKLQRRAVGEYEAWVDKFEEQSNKELERYQTNAERILKQQQTQADKELERAKKEFQQMQVQVQRAKRQALSTNILLQRETDRQEDRERRVVERLEDRMDRAEDRSERQRVHAKNEEWHDETRQWRIEDREERQQTHAQRAEEHQEDREWRLEQRDRSGQDREERETRETFERIYEQAHLDNRLYDQEETLTPRLVPENAMMEGTAIIAGAGWGKTQLLNAITARHLERPDPPGMIILDSTGAMVDNISRLQLFNEHMRDRIMIVDPLHAPPINMLDFSSPRYANYTPDQREDLQTDLTNIFNYVFTSSEYDLTGPMGTAFGYAIKLMLNRPNSTIHDLKALLEDPARKYEDSTFKNDIDKLPYGDDFFKKHFFADSLRATRASVARRIHNLLLIPAFRRMFTAQHNSIDLYSAVQNGSVVLVNTNQNLLKKDGMTLFGRYMIASTLTAAFERATTPFNQRRPAFLIIDEAAPYFDETFEELFTRARQFKLATIIAFQHLEQATDRMRSAISSSTRVKYAASLGPRDRRRMADDMETTPEFFTALKKDLRNPNKPYWSEFACYVRPDFPTACVEKVDFYQIENMPRMSDEQHSALLARCIPKPTKPEGPAKAEASHQYTVSPANAAKLMTTSEVQPSWMPAAPLPSPSLVMGSAHTQTTPDPSAPALWEKKKK